MAWSFQAGVGHARGNVQTKIYHPISEILSEIDRKVRIPTKKKCFSEKFYEKKISKKVPIFYF